MGIGELNAGGNPARMDYHASHPGGVEILLVASCSRNWETLRPDEPLVSYAYYPYDAALDLKGHRHGILASCYNAEICSYINENQNIMMQICYLVHYYCTKTIYCCLTLSMARMEMD